MGDFKAVADKLVQDLDSALNNDNENSYLRMSQILDAVSDELREFGQGLTADDMKKLAAKLKGNDPLTTADIEHLRLWIVGDAETYINIENSVQEWKQEVRRLTDEIRIAAVSNPTIQDIFKLQALIRDTDRVVDDLAYFASQKGRVAKFNNAINNLTREDRDLLFGLMNTKLQSKHY